MPGVYPCPLCGRSIDQYGGVLDDPEKTKAHIDETQDNVHEDEQGADWTQAIAESAVDQDGDDHPQPPTASFDAGEAPKQRIEVPGHDGGTIVKPLPDTVRVNREILMSPEDYGIPSSESVRGLEGRIGVLEKQMDELRIEIGHLSHVIDVMAAEGSNFIVGECAECEAKLDVEASSDGDERVVCPDCGHVEATSG